MKLRSIILVCMAGSALTACHSTSFAPKGGVDSSQKTSAAEFESNEAGSGDDVAGTVSQPGGGSDTGRQGSSTEPSVCRDRLAGQGFTEVSKDVWRATKDVACDWGLGYEKSEITVNLAELPGYCPDTFTSERGTIVKKRVIENHCLANTRCAQLNSREALGRLAWVIKCENQVPAFHNFLEVVRMSEGCAADFSDLPGKVCLFSKVNGTGAASELTAKFYPIVNTGTATQGSLLDQMDKPHQIDLGADSAPMPTVHTMQAYLNVDQLRAPEIQNQITDPCPDPAKVQPIDAACVPGCYRADQRIMLSASGKYRQIKQAQDASVGQMAVLARDSTLAKPRFTNMSVGRFISSVQDAEETLLHITSVSGIKLAVTPNHPLLDGQGYMREASALKVGDQLLRVDGRPDAIKSIEPDTFFGKVYNVSPVSNDPRDNLVVAEGVLSGSHNYQTTMQSLINRQILRSNLADGF